MHRQSASSMARRLSTTSTWLSSSSGRIPKMTDQQLSCPPSISSSSFSSLESTIQTPTSTSFVIRRNSTLVIGRPQSKHPIKSPLSTTTTVPWTTQRNHHQRQQRYFASYSRDNNSRGYYKDRENAKLMNKNRKKDPFQILGVGQKEQYSVVKVAFLTLAMKHHPDTQGNGSSQTEEEEQASRDMFIAVRKAFEELVEGPEGVAILRKESDKAWEEEELNNWFKNQSGGFDMPFLDAQTMKEVAEMTEKVGGGGEAAGLDRDGGMWTLARMVSRDVSSGGDGKSILQLESGDVKDRQIDGELRRRRRF